MANILACLFNSAQALDAYTRVLQVTQNNVANASTPGWARQSLPLVAQQADLQGASAGGITVGQLQSARDEYAEQAVRRQESGLGTQQQLVNSLSALQSIFDISGKTGIPYSMNQFFAAASAWAQTPGNQAARQLVMDRATDVAADFRNTANRLDALSHDTDTQLGISVARVNELVGQLQTYNRAILQGSGANDAGMDAQIHTTLDNLAQLVGFTAIRQNDGTTTILMNGTTPLLVGDHQYSLRLVPDAGAPDVPATMKLVAADGSDITAPTTQGQLAALLGMRNQVMGSYLGDATQPGDLNRLALQFASRVNYLLTQGTLSDGPPPVQGAALFKYDTAHPTNVARSLIIDGTLDASQLAATDPGPPYCSNGVPLALSNLATPTGAADEIDGMSYSEFYGNLASNAGSQLQTAQDNAQVQNSLVAQAQDQRQQSSGVSLDEEAMVLVEFQRAYEANSRFITVLNQLTETIINILQ